MTATDVLAAIGFVVVIVAAAAVARAAPAIIKDWSAGAVRLVRWRMNRRLPNPDPAWRAPLTRARYRIGLALLRPYLARLYAYTGALHDEHKWRPVAEEPTATDVDERGRERFMFGRWISVAHILRLDDEAGYGEGPGYRRHIGTRDGWPVRFRLWTV